MKMKKISLVIALVAVIAILAACGAATPLCGIWGHGAETIVFDGYNFEVSGGEGHRHFPNGTGTFEVTNSEIILTYDDGNVETRPFSRVDSNSITVSGHRYRRR